MRHLLNYLVVAVVAFSALFTGFTQAQNTVATEAEMVKQAQKHFDSKNYALALPLYSQIVSNQPDNVVNNYYLGVCLLKVDGNKADAVRFLTIATKSDEVPVNAWLYLGTALHQAYRFDEAITTLQIFRKNAGKQSWKEAEGDKLIQMCQNAINLNNDLSLLRHSIMNENETNCFDFVTGYKNIAESGRFLKLPKEYESKQSKDRQEASLLFLNAKGNMMVFAGPGKSGQTGFDIFKVTKDAKGLWMFPEPISAAINSDGDEAYPVLVNDGKTIYFSSNGNKSTGGYDVFRSDLNTVTGNWSEPVPMGSPVNSPGNDFYYIPLADHKTAYFSSDRESPSGKCKVYTASVINDDRNFVTLNGTFICPAGLDLSDAKVTILNSGDRSLLAQFRTSSQNGNYFLRLPTPSKLIYQVKLHGFGELESEVELNSLSEVVLMQEILVKRDGKGKESVKITTKTPEVVPVLVAKSAVIANETSQTIVEKNSAAPATLAADGSMSSADAGENTSVPLVSIVKAKSQEEPEAKSNKNVSEAAPETAMPLVAIVNTSEMQQPVIAADPKAVTAEKEAEMPMVSIVNTKSQNEIAVADDKKAVTTTTEPVMSEVSIVNTPTQDLVTVSQDKNSVAVESKNDIAAVSEKQPEVSNPELKKETRNQELAKTNSAAPVSTVTDSKSVNIAEPVAVKENISESNKSKSAVTSAQVKTEKVEVPSASEPAAIQPAVEHIAIVTINSVNSVLPVEAGPAQPFAATTQKRGLFGARSNKKSPSDTATQIAEVLPPAAAPVIQEKPKLHNVVFKVQLGAFRDRTEAEVKKKFEKTGIKDLEYIKNSEGFLVVVTGNESDYTTATKIKDSIIKKGISDAFVVVYSGDNRLPVSMVVFEEEE